MADLYHGGSKPDNSRRLWVTENLDYAREYADRNRGRVYHLALDLSRWSVLDLRPAGLDAARAAEILRDAGLTAYGHEDEEPHCVLARTADADLRAAGYDAVMLHECTDGVETDSLCLVGR